ncbi:MAG: M20/M25/M40 family metallo-hydrolase, partial [Clostridia bacterium]|nr:M20/M25/M40 family metallo-hydrolase [Clostridia bacterium]
MPVLTSNKKYSIRMEEIEEKHMVNTEGIKAEVQAVFPGLLAFCQDLLRIPSYTFEEKGVVERVVREMEALGYDQAFIDKTGNAVGIIGEGPVTVMFDSHADTVREGDRSLWSVDPFGAEIRDGLLYGLGASDMKCPGAVSVYAAALLKKLDLCQNKRIVVSFSTMEEDMDGVALRQVIANNDLHPDCVIIPEPTDLRLCRGHGGRVLYRLDMSGKSSHGSRPEDGINAVYLMQEIVRRVEAWSTRLLAENRRNGSVALTKIESKAASMNAVPYHCSAYLDRRITVSQTEESLAEEMDALVAGTGAKWSIVTTEETTWNGEQAFMRCLFPAFALESDHPLVQASHKAYKALTGKEITEFRFKGTTNAVSSA